VVQLKRGKADPNMTIWGFTAEECIHEEMIHEESAHEEIIHEESIHATP
jgi:hypothetical protein